MLPGAHMISPHAGDRWRLGLAFGSGLMLGVSFAPLDLAGLACVAPGLFRRGR
jgi:hypothetical protein